MGSLPTIVAGFDGKNWTGAAILFLAPPTALLAGYADRRRGSVADVKDSVIKEVLGFLQAQSPEHPDTQSIKTFLQSIGGTAPQDMVITAEYERDDLGTYDPGWLDRISSLFMIGDPGGRTLKLFEQANQRSHELHVRMPNRHIASSYWTIHESAFQKGFASTPVIPDPGSAQDGRSAKYPWGSFGNMAKSFRWDT